MASTRSTSAALWLIATSLAQLATAADTTCSNGVWGLIDQNKDNKTALNAIPAPGWVPEPGVRGTFSILQTCLLTLVACIYSALHLNVPYRTGFWPMLRTKIIWVLMALFAPEIVLFAAVKQFYEAWRLSRDLRLEQDSAPAGSEEKKFQFDTKYGFFVVMGGVQIELSRLERFISHPDLDPEWDLKLEVSRSRQRPTVRLTPNAIVTLARLGHWVDIHPREIRDRSKADGIQKVLVLVQVSWMMVSCVARALYGLPLTLLEIHTMVHVVCALFMYAFWFKKPVDIRDPQLKTFPDSWDDALAYMCQHTFYGPSCWGLNLSRSSTSCHLEADNWLVPLPCGISTDFHVQHENRTHVQPQGLGLALDATGTVPPTHDVSIITARWHATIRTLYNLGVDLSDKTHVTTRLLDHGEAFHFRHGTTPLDDLSPPQRFFDKHSWRRASIMVLPVLYGGIHMSAWSFAFATQAESVLWRVSCLVTMATIPAYCACHYLVEFLPRFERLPAFFRSDDLWGWCVFPMLCVAAPVYVFCRIFLVVESFVSLRSVPVGAYWVPAWLQYIPHV